MKSCNKIIFTTIFCLFLLSSISIGLTVFAAVEEATITAYESPAPIIDGKFNIGEWNLAYPASVKLYDFYNQSRELNIEIMALFSADLILYIGVIVPDVSASGDDNIAIAFKTNEAEPLIKGGGVDPFTFGNHHDIKSYFPQGSLSIDGYTSDVGMNCASDIPASGVNDLTAAHNETGTYVTFEFAFPMDSGDTYGYDVQLAVGNEIEIFSWFVDDDTGKIYSQCRETDADYDYNVLYISAYTTPVSVPIVVIITGLISISATFLINKRKRRH